MKVIPAINGLKAQLAAVFKSVSSVSVLEAVVTELKASQEELTRKVGELSVKLADVRANVKTLEGWVVAIEFTQIPGGVGCLLYLRVLLVWWHPSVLVVP